MMSSLVGCGSIPPADHKEVSESVISYLSNDLPKNTYRIYFCQGKSYSKQPNKEISESWIQLRNIQINIYDGDLKIASLNNDEVAAMDFSKYKKLNFDWRFERTNAKLTEGFLILNPDDAEYGKNIKIAHQKIDRVLSIAQSPDVSAIGGTVSMYGGQYGYIFPMTLSTSVKFCENKRIVFYKKMN